MQKILLVGAGRMAREYAKVLKAQNLDFWVIGRSEKSAAEFKKETGVDVLIGGLSPEILQKEKETKTAIVATSIESLGENARLLLKHNFTSILLEKPAGLNRKDIEATAALAREKSAKIFVGYNRRFYASVAKAKEFISKDGGVISCTFDFTEHESSVKNLPVASEVKKEWFLANSSHVVDLAFFLAGRPKFFETYTGGALSWHPKAAVFVGSGITESGVLFSYHANWLSGGQWGVEIMTPKRKLILRPLEILQVQEKESFAISKVSIDDGFEKSLKPGLYNEVKSFLEGNLENHLEIQTFVSILPAYETILKK